MPIIRVVVPEKRSEESSKALIEKITDAIDKAGCGPADRVRVVIQESEQLLQNGIFELHLSGERIRSSLVEILLIEGRSPEMKQRLIEDVTAAVKSVDGLRKDSVICVVQEIPSSAWGIAGRTARELGR